MIKDTNHQKRLGCIQIKGTMIYHFWCARTRWLIWDIHLTEENASVEKNEDMNASLKTMKSTNHLKRLGCIQIKGTMIYHFWCGMTRRLIWGIHLTEENASVENYEDMNAALKTKKDTNHLKRLGCIEIKGTMIYHFWCAMTRRVIWGIHLTEENASVE